MTAKYCIKCNDPLYTIELPGNDELCACCAMEADPIDEIKQEAYANGWFAALNERNSLDCDGKFTAIDCDTSAINCVITPLDCVITPDQGES